MKPKVSGKKEIIILRAKTNEAYNRKTIEQNYEPKSWFSEKIKKMNKLLFRLIRKKEITHITNIINEVTLIQVLKI